MTSSSASCEIASAVSRVVGTAAPLDDCHLDTETYSECDLQACGAYKYAENKTTELLVAVYRFGADGPLRIWVPRAHLPQSILDGLVAKYDPARSGVRIYVHLAVPTDLREHIERGGTVRGHNVGQFERIVLNGVAGRKLGFPLIRIEQCVCTAAKVASCSLPRKLGEAAKALGTHLKDEEGRATMLALSKPRRGKERRWTPENAPERFLKLYNYCVDDVLAECGIDEKIPDLSPYETRVYQLDQRANDRGWAIDLPAIDDILSLVVEYKQFLAASMEKATRSMAVCKVEGPLYGTLVEVPGFKPSQREAISNWIKANGWPQLTDMTAGTVNRLTQDSHPCPPNVKHVLRIYSTYGMKAVSKYETMLDMVCADGRLHGMFVYYGASTGRWSSKGVQLQNLFRPVIDDPETAVEAFSLRSLDWIRSLYNKDPMKVLASCVRSVLISAPGKDLIFPDFAGIESRVNAWLWREDWKLLAFIKYDAKLGPDLYCVIAGRAFHIDPETMSKKHPLRQLGKVLDLAFGYEGGVAALVEWAAQYEIDLDAMAKMVLPLLSPEILDSAEWMWNKFGRGMQMPDESLMSRETYLACDGLKQLWRRDHGRTKAGWKSLKVAATLAIEHPGKTYACANSKIHFKVDGEWLKMRLPSGRTLKYFRPSLDYGALTEEEAARGYEPDKTIRYYGVDTKTRVYRKTYTYGGKLCLARGTEVLTRSGWKRIEECGSNDELWDGAEWVSNDGLAVQGTRPVMTFCGVELTPDHEVLTDDGWKTAAVAQSEGLNGADVRLPEYCGVRSQREGQDVLVGPVHLRQDGSCGRRGAVALTWPEPSVLRLQKRGDSVREDENARHVSLAYLRGVAQYATALRLAVSRGMAQLRRARDSGVQALEQVRAFLRGHGRRVLTGADTGAAEQRPRVLQEELLLGHAHAAEQQQARQCFHRDAAWARDGVAGVAPIRGERDHDSVPDRAGLAGTRLAETYDLLNAGPRRRFTVRGKHGTPLIVHNCENAVQAISRDLLVDAMLRLEDAGYDTIGSVHDETIMEVDENFGSLDEVGKIMCTLPAWAAELPVAIDGHRARRYRK